MFAFLPQIHSESICTQHCVVFFMIHLVHLVLPIFSGPWGLSLEYGQSTRSHILKENRRSLSPQLLIANSCSAGGGASCPSPFATLHLHAHGLPERKLVDKSSRWALAQR